MSEKSAQYIKLFKKNLDRIVIATLFLILAGLIFVWFQETTGTVGTEAGGGEPAKLVDPVAENKHYNRVLTLTQQPELTSYPAIQQIALYNMFDYKSVRDKSEIERGADQRFVQAQDAATKGNAEEAKRLLAEILRQVPSHRKARELLEKLNSTPANAASTPAANPAVPQ